VCSGRHRVTSTPWSIGLVDPAITSTPAPEMPALPLLFRFFVDDVAYAIRSLHGARHVTPAVEHSAAVAGKRGDDRAA
jgi:hypothetical protein